MLEQFATRGVNMSLLESRPIGDALGRYRFVIDLDGHILDERVADALLGLKRFSPNVIFLGIVPAGRPARRSTVTPRYDNEAFVEARDWLRGSASAGRAAVGDLGRRPAASASATASSRQLGRHSHAQRQRVDPRGARRPCPESPSSSNSCGESSRAHELLPFM